MNACHQQIPSISRRSPTPSPPRSRRGSIRSRRSSQPRLRTHSSRRHGANILPRSRRYSSSSGTGYTSSEAEDRAGPSINSSSAYTPHMVDKMRRKLRYYFMTPCDKYRARKRIPHKLWLQFLKIILVTIQLLLFSSERSVYVDFLNRSSLAFRHLYCQNWDPSYETIPYPPATGQYALYKRQDLFDYVDFSMSQYNKTMELAVGPFSFQNHVEDGQFGQHVDVCVKHYQSTSIRPSNFTIDLNPDLEQDCYKVYPVNESTYDFKEFLTLSNRSISLDRLFHLKLKLKLKYIHMSKPGAFSPKTYDATCLLVNVDLTFDNSGNTGQVLVLLDTHVKFKDCEGSNAYENEENLQKGSLVTFDVVVIILCLISTLLCIRSLIKSAKLCKEARKFFLDHYSHEFTRDDTMEFVSFWFILIIISDILTIAGSGVKVAIRLGIVHQYDACGMLLGLANICVWIGVLRYIGHFKKYNVLILTVKHSMPNILRFLLCAATFYVAYTLCGWAVLGPYHLKFTTVMKSSECLFSLVNGDDMYVTFSVLNNPRVPMTIYIFSRIYLYSFISLFIYIVLSLFIAVIMDTYETIKHCYEHGFPKTAIWKFIAEYNDDPHSHLFLSDVQQKRTKGCCLFPCCIREADEPDDTVNIVA